MSASGAIERGGTSQNFLEFERQVYVDAYIKLGFHKLLNLSEKEYSDSLPKFKPQPEVFKGIFEIPILADGRIPDYIQARRVGLGYPLGLKSVDWEGDPKGYRTPKEPYTAWIQDGTKNLGVPVAEVRKNLASYERCASTTDSIPLYIRKGLILVINHSVDLPMTEFPPGYAAYLSLDCGVPGICLSSIQRPNKNWGSATCGRE